VAKNVAQVVALFALANLWMPCRSLLSATGQRQKASGLRL
jgi:hypothetical protein